MFQGFLQSTATAGAELETWLTKEEDAEALFFLRVLLSLKIYDRGRAYARYRILHDRGYWHRWKEVLP